MVGPMHEGRLTPWYLTVLAFCGFITVTTEFSVVGLVPVMAEGMEIPIAQAGSLMGWFAIAAALAGPVVTLAFSYGNRRRFIVGSTLLFVVGNLAMAVFPSYPVAVAVRIIQGCLLPAIIATVMVTAAQLVPPSRSGWAVSRANTGVALATVIGIPALSWISDISSWRVAFASVAGMGLVSALLLFRCIPFRQVDRATPAKDVYRLMRTAPFWVHLLSTTLIFTGMFTGYTYLVPILEDSLEGISTTLLLLCFGVSGLVGSWLIGYTLKRKSDLSAITLSVTLAVAMVLMSIGDLAPAGIVMALVIVWGAVHTAQFTVTLSRSLEVGSVNPELAVALNLSACNVGIAIGAWLGGYLKINLGLETLPIIGAIAVFMGALLTLSRSQDRALKMVG